jgi:hypothetical protein
MALATGGDGLKGCEHEQVWKTLREDFRDNGLQTVQNMLRILDENDKTQAFVLVQLLQYELVFPKRHDRLSLAQNWCHSSCAL